MHGVDCCGFAPWQDMDASLFERDRQSGERM
jgi:hypothetical protein